MKLDDNGNINYGLDEFTPAPAPRVARNQPGQGVNDNDPVFNPPPQNPGNENSPILPGDGATDPLNPQPLPKGGGAPGGGNINDPAYLDSLISYYGSQPGVNPSVKNDPQYWKDAVGSGRFNGDENYLIQRFFQPEGAPEGSGGGAPATSGSGGGSSLTDFLTQLMKQNASSQSTVNGQRQSVLNRLFGLADQYSKPVTADDPSIKAPTDAYTGQVNRSVASFKKQAAERALAEGVPSGAFDSQIGNATMAGGRAVGDYETQLMHDEMLSRRQSLSDVLNQSGGLLSAQDSADINSRIASIDAALKSKGIDVTQELGLGGLAAQNKGLDIQNSLGGRALDNQGKSITNQNNQFYDQLGSTNANQGASLDDVLASLLLGGS